MMIAVFYVREKRSVGRLAEPEEVAVRALVERHEPGHNIPQPASTDAWHLHRFTSGGLDRISVFGCVNGNRRNAPVHMVVSEGDAACGLVLDAGGQLAGTPTSAGSYRFIAKVTDSGAPAQSAAAAFAISVQSSSNPPPATLGISTGSLPAASTSGEYSAALTASGERATYTCTSFPLPRRPLFQVYPHDPWTQCLTGAHPRAPVPFLQGFPKAR